jgi:hypothetical protein
LSQDASSTSRFWKPACALIAVAVVRMANLRMNAEERQQLPGDEAKMRVKAALA